MDEATAELQRFWAKVAWGEPPAHAPELGPCLVWTAQLDPSGYPRFRPRSGSRKAYKWAYEVYVGPVPAGLELDHLCRNRACINVCHLEPVTHQENIIRGHALRPRPTHCKNGHEFTEANTYRPPGSGYLKCVECRRSYRKRRSLSA